MIVAVASGKGGTGKTTVAASLAAVWDGPVLGVDLDVEEPNLHLFLQPVMIGSELAYMPVPEVEEAKCTYCGACSELCQFKAISVFNQVILTFPEMCHGCGGCMLVCPKKAIREIPRRIGIIEKRQAGAVTLIQGRLAVGEAMSPPLIRAVKKRLDPSLPAILDAPPGTSCPVIVTLRGADFILLVTEPTPFGLHDLKLAVDMVRELGIPFGVLVNRAGSGDDRVHVFCRGENIPILAEIPDDRRIAEAYSRGELIVEALPEYHDLFAGLAEKLLASGKEKE
jgi:MinD superfamily P-loop ATPase